MARKVKKKIEDFSKNKEKNKIDNLLYNGITTIMVRDYKSLIGEKEIEVRPLTIIAGSNSSGKSSIIQPLLLIKQTLEQSYDPGALLLNGPNVRFTKATQLLPLNRGINTFSIKIKVNKKMEAEVFFKHEKNKPGFQVAKMNYKSDNDEMSIESGMDPSKFKHMMPQLMLGLYDKFIEEKESLNKLMNFSIVRERSFLKIALHIKQNPDIISVLFKYPDDQLEQFFRDIIHLPGLRGNPERTYPTTSIDSTYGDDKLPGTFEKYVASIVTHWQENSINKIKKLEEHLSKIGLTNKIKTEIINDTQVSISVGNLLSADNDEYVSIADVGLGVSQTLPVIVALIYAKPGQMVYIEQPEIHLHPKAQYMLASLLVEAANRGVKVVVETHSSILIRGIQTLVAEEEISNQLVKLHWFRRNEITLETEINSANLDDIGRFGDWPEDFDDITMMAEIRYLDAAEKKEFERNNKE